MQVLLGKPHTLTTNPRGQHENKVFAVLVVKEGLLLAHPKGDSHRQTPEHKMHPRRAETANKDAVSHTLKRPWMCLHMEISQFMVGTARSVLFHNFL